MDFGQFLELKSKKIYSISRNMDSLFIFLEIDDILLIKYKKYLIMQLICVMILRQPEIFAKYDLVWISTTVPTNLV